MIVIEETLRRHLTHLGYQTFVALIAIVGLAASRFDRPGSMWPPLMVLQAVIAGAGAIGPEFSSGTLQLILVKPINRAVYLLARVAGIVAAVLVGGLAGLFCEVVGRLLWSGGRGIAVAATAFANTALECLLICAMLVLFGSLTRAYFNVAIYFAIEVGISIFGGILAMTRASRGSLGRFLEAHEGLERALPVITANLFPDAPPRFDAGWTLLVLSNAAIALVLACLAFRRREVPYGAD
ncbi:MAG TPA: ABC transporter permease subunit [Thermoanaerobaculia bacterium]